jgi:hypothetical protein
MASIISSDASGSGQRTSDFSTASQSIPSVGCISTLPMRRT